MLALVGEEAHQFHQMMELSIVGWYAVDIVQEQLHRLTTVARVGESGRIVVVWLTFQFVGKIIQKFPCPSTTALDLAIRTFKDDAIFEFIMILKAK